VTTTYSEQALAGVREIAGGTLRGGLQFTPEVKAAIAAGLAVDADPYFMMSDMLIGPSARLTPEGQALARERGDLTACVCPGCDREASRSPSGYCQSCLRAGNRSNGGGQWGGWINGDQCYDHYLTTHPEVAAERTRLLREATPTRGRHRDYASQRRYSELLGYIDPSDQRSEDKKGIPSWHYGPDGRVVWDNLP